MIRDETDTHWILVTHPDHARLAGEFADAWGNARFPRPQPFSHIAYAIYHHDDGWKPRDAEPSLTKQNRPEAFTKALVGAYSAFEEIDLPSYLGVRGRATADVAAGDEYAGILVSMHTCNLLTEQADLSTIRPEHRPAHAQFIAEQRAWQATTAAKLGAKAEELQRGFEFLQCCDNLSLIVCSAYGSIRELRHTHPDVDGVRQRITCVPLGQNTYYVDPWPCRESKVVFSLPFRLVAKKDVTDLDSYRRAFHAATVKHLTITLIPA